MAEEQTQVEKKEEVTTNTETQDNKPQEPSPEQLRAMDKGWRPKEEWQGDPDEWVDAREFNLREPIFAQLALTKRQLKEQQKVIDDLKAFTKRTEQVAYDRALETLRQEKKAALEAGDADKLLDIDDKIADIKTEQALAKRAQQEAPQAEVNPEWTAWVHKNPWYQVNPDLHDQADAMGIAYAKSNPTKSPQDVLKYVEQEIKKANPHLFSNPARNRPSAVDSGNKSMRGNNTADDIQLSEDEQRVMNRFIRNGVMTKDEYIASIKKLEK